MTCMNMSDQELASAVRRANPANSAAPSFGDVWSGAEKSYLLSKRRYAWFASAAAVVAAVVVALYAGAPTLNDNGYIELAELMDSTSWAAPSDVLMPEYEIDIYQDLPTLMESTKPVEGALL